MPWHPCIIFGLPIRFLGRVLIKLSLAKSKIVIFRFFGVSEDKVVASNLNDLPISRYRIYLATPCPNAIKVQRKKCDGHLISGGLGDEMLPEKNKRKVFEPVNDLFWFQITNAKPTYLSWPIHLLLTEYIFMLSKISHQFYVKFHYCVGIP